MPRISPTGQISELRRDWYDATRTLGQVCAGGHCAIYLSDGTVLADRPANETIGGGGHWAGWLTTEEGIFGSMAVTLPGWGLGGAMGEDGSFAAKVHDSYGPWFIVQQDGAHREFWQSDAYCIQISPEGVSWTAGNLPMATFGNPPDRHVWSLRWSHGWSYQDIETGALCLNGHVLMPAGDYYYHDHRWMGAFWIVTWSPNQADTDAQTRTYTPAELSALPRIGESLPKPPEPPTPPEPPVTDLPDQTSVVAAVRARYGTPLGAQHAQCLMEIATAIGHDAGLLRKPDGSNVTLPDGTKVSQDIICFPNGHIYDCLGDAEGQASPGWSDKGMLDASRYYRVSSVPPPPDPPDPPDSGESTHDLILKLGRHLGAWQ